MPKKTATTPAPAGEQTEAIALSRVPAFQPIEIEIARDILPLQGKQYNVADEHGMIEAKTDLKTITSYLTRLEQARKVTKDEPFRLCQLIDSEAKRISQPVETGIKAPLKALIEQEESRLERIEAARVEAIRKRIADISRRPGWGAKAVDIRTMLNYVESVEVDAAFAELQDEATVAKAEALRDLRQMIQTAEQVEQQQADLERRQDELRRQEAELKAGHARLREQAALAEQQAAAADVVAGDVTAQVPSSGGVAVGRDMAHQDKPLIEYAPLTIGDYLEMIIALCDRLTFAVDGDDAHEMVGSIREIARNARELIPG